MCTAYHLLSTAFIQSLGFVIDVILSCLVKGTSLDVGKGGTVVMGEKAWKVVEVDLM
jgi:hypothetical protein